MLDDYVLLSLILHLRDHFRQLSLGSCHSFRGSLDADGGRFLIGNVDGDSSLFLQTVDIGASLACKTTKKMATVNISTRH